MTASFKLKSHYHFHEDIDSALFEFTHRLITLIETALGHSADIPQVLYYLESQDRLSMLTTEALSDSLQVDLLNTIMIPKAYYHEMIAQSLSILMAQQNSLEFSF